MIGQKFAHLCVAESAGSNKRGDRLWKCTCDCGNTTIVKTNNLRSGRIKSCGCKKKGPKRNDDIIGQRFGRLMITGFSHSDACRASIYDYRCDCGEIGKVRKHHLMNGKTRSCGCLSVDRLWHGYKEISGSYWYRLQIGAKERSYIFDITIEEVWDIFEKQSRKCIFTGLPLAFSKSFKSKEQTASLDRINPDLGYVRGNVQWVHKEINMMRGKRTVDEFIKWCKLVAQKKDEIDV